MVDYLFSQSDVFYWVVGCPKFFYLEFVIIWATYDGENDGGDHDKVDGNPQYCLMSCFTHYRSFRDGLRSQSLY